MDWKTHKKILQKNPKFLAALQDVEPEFQVAKALIEARLRYGLTQEELARRLKTKKI